MWHSNLQNHYCKIPNGIPQDIVSERGPQFTSQVWREFCSELRGQVSLSSGFHSQTTGQVESTNQDLEAADSSKQTMWSDQLVWVEYAHNSSTSTATGVSPFKVSLSYQPPRLSIMEGELVVPSVQHHMRRCQQAWWATRSAVLGTADQNKRWADRRP